MGLLAPWFIAAGAAAVALPIWLHLLRKHRTTPTPFSSLMFFERRTQSSIKHRRLQYLLLFALRAALVAALAFAFAKPYLNRHVAGLAGGALRVIAIDESFSMRQGDRMARAKREAAAALKDGARHQVIAFASQARLLTDGAAGVEAARSAIESIEPTDSRGSYAELVRVVRMIAASTKQPLEVHLFSDLQKSSLPPGFADLRLPAGATLAIHPTGADRIGNWTVESIVAPRRVYDAGKTRVRAVLAGFGTEAGKRRASVALNGRVLESKDVDIPKSGRAPVEFAIADVPHGLNRAEVRIEPADGFPNDDRIRFAIERLEKRPALFVDETRNSRALLFFRSALEASANPAFALEQAGPADAARANLTRYAFVVIADGGAVSEAFEENLKQYAMGGGSVWIALGPSAAARPRIPLTASTKVEGRNYARGNERFQTVSYVDTGHPSLTRGGRLEGVRFFYAVRVTAPGARVVARLADETPLLSEIALGQGKALVFASTFDNVSNDFPLHAAFVPFVEETARYLAGATEGAPYVTVDSHAELRRASDRAASIEVIDPGGQRALSLKEAASAATFQLDREGFYEVRRGNGRHELIAVNADRRESDFETAAPETLALWRKSGPAAASAAAGGAETEQRSTSLWWYVLALALAVALAESWVGNRYLAREPEPAPKLYKEMAA